MAVDRDPLKTTTSLYELYLGSACQNSTEVCLFTFLLPVTVKSGRHTFNFKLKMKVRTHLASNPCLYSIQTGKREDKALFLQHASQK